MHNVILEPEQEEETPYSPGQKKEEDEAIEFDKQSCGPSGQQRGSSDIEGYTPDCESAESDIN